MKSTNARLLSALIIVLMFQAVCMSVGFSDATKDFNAAIDLGVKAAQEACGDVILKGADAYYAIDGAAAGYAIESFSEAQESSIAVIIKSDNGALSVQSVSLGVPIHKNPLNIKAAASAVAYKFKINITAPKYFLMLEDNSIWAVYEETADGSPIVCDIATKTPATLAQLEGVKKDTAPAASFGASSTLPKILTFKVIGDISSSKTSKREIILTNLCMNSPTHYMVSEAKDFFGAAWLDYSNAPKYILSEGVGKKTIYFKVKNADGESTVKKSSISLVPPSVKKLQANEKGSSFYENDLTLYNVCEGSPTHYMVSEYMDFYNAEWKDYSNAPKFTVSIGVGKKTIYFKIKNEVGESSVKKISIKILAPSIKYFKINNGASKIYDKIVTLNNVCLGNPTEFLASESRYFEGAVWQPYSAEPQYTLSDISGKKTVYFKVRTKNGESASKNSSVTYYRPLDVKKCIGDYQGPFETEVKSHGFKIGEIDLDCFFHIDDLEQIGSTNNYALFGYLQFDGEAESEGDDQDINDTIDFDGDVIAQLEGNYLRFEYKDESDGFEYKIKGKIYEDKTTGSIDYDTDLGFDGDDDFTWKRVIY